MLIKYVQDLYFSWGILKPKGKLPSSYIWNFCRIRHEAEEIVLGDGHLGRLANLPERRVNVELRDADDGDDDAKQNAPLGVHVVRRPASDDARTVS